MEDKMSLDCQCGVQKSELHHNLLPNVWKFEECTLTASVSDHMLLIHVPKSRMTFAIRIEDFNKVLDASLKKFQELKIKKEWKDLKND